MKNQEDIFKAELKRLLNKPKFANLKNYTINLSTISFKPPITKIKLAARQDIASKPFHGKGQAACAPSDIYNPFVGFSIALTRALEALSKNQNKSKLAFLRDPENVLDDFFRNLANLSTSSK